MLVMVLFFIAFRLIFFFSSRIRHTICYRDWSSDVCSSDLEFVATLEQVEERDRPVNAGDLDRAVELDHRQPPPGRGDLVALTGVRLLADQQLVARRLPGGQVDDWRLAGEFAARVAGRGRHGVVPFSLVWSSCRSGPHRRSWRARSSLGRWPSTVTNRCAVSVVIGWCC